MRALAILGCAGVIAFTVEDARSDTIHVPADYSTIYEALDAAVSGDVVEVAPGTYDQSDTRPAWFGDDVSSVGFLKSGVLLRSSGGAGVTTLRMDSSLELPVILFGGTGEFHVQGFMFTGSLAHLIAIAIETADFETGSLVLEDCVIGNFGFESNLVHGYAMHTYNAGIEIRRCRFENIASPAVIAAFFYGGQVLIEDSEFENCPAGGILAFTIGDPNESMTVKRCSFVRNGGPSLGAGALAMNFSPFTLFEDSYFFQNHRGVDFGGEGAFFHSTLIVRGSTFAETASAPEPSILALSDVVELTGNTFYGGPAGGTALHFFGIAPGSRLALQRNVLSYSVQEAAVRVSSASVQSSCNVFWQSTGGHTEGFTLGPTDLVSDPQFCDAPAQNFTVNASSPCLPWNNNGCGQIGAWGLGCGDVSVEPSSWGQIKALYR